MACSSASDAGPSGSAGAGAGNGAGASSGGATSSTAGASGAGVTGVSGGSAGANSAGASNGGASGAAGGGAGSAGAISGAGASNGGASGAAGSAGSAGAAPVGACGPTTHNEHPFGCKLAWGGAADNESTLSKFSYLQFMSYWIDSSISAQGKYTTCSGCAWLTSKVASTPLIPAYYAYIIGFLAHANGIVDGNQAGSKKLTVDGAALVKANRSAIVDAYAWYAQATHTAWPTKPLVWLLEGDFVQLSDAGQTSPMTMTEVGQLATDITCAIKSNMPNAVVAIDQSSWNSDETTNAYWGALKNANYDLVWTTGVGNNQGYIEAGTNSSTYNHATATYAYLHQLTGRRVLVDTSAGASAAGDSWSAAGASELNSRIAEGVIGVNVSGSAPSASIANITGLSALPSCP